jgi:hypothetical protein
MGEFYFLAFASASCCSPSPCSLEVWCGSRLRPAYKRSGASTPHHFHFPFARWWHGWGTAPGWDQWNPHSLMMMETILWHCNCWELAILYLYSSTVSCSKRPRPNSSQKPGYVDQHRVTVSGSVNPYIVSFKVNLDEKIVQRGYMCIHSLCIEGHPSTSFFSIIKSLSLMKESNFCWFRCWADLGQGRASQWQL